MNWSKLTSVSLCSVLFVVVLVKKYHCGQESSLCLSLFMTPHYKYNLYREFMFYCGMTLKLTKLIPTLLIIFVSVWVLNHMACIYSVISDYVYCISTVRYYWSVGI